MSSQPQVHKQIAKDPEAASSDKPGCGDFKEHCLTPPMSNVGLERPSAAQIARCRRTIVPTRTASLLACHGPGKCWLCGWDERESIVAPVPQILPVSVNLKTQR
jgi:hypothetical protein